jgi:hypothetical protein
MKNAKKFKLVCNKKMKLWQQTIIGCVLFSLSVDPPSPRPTRSQQFNFLHTHSEVKPWNCLLPVSLFISSEELLANIKGEIKFID